MTRDDILRMAHEAGFVLSSNATDEAMGRFERFAALAAAAEREACAALADRAAAESNATYEQCVSARDPNLGLVAAGAREQAKKLSEAIRARGQQ